MSKAVIEYIIENNKDYYSDYSDLFDLINNPSFDPNEDPYSRRYVVEDDYGYSEMPFAMFYTEDGDLALAISDDYSEEFYDLVGDDFTITGDDVLGFSILLDMILLKTVPESPTVWKSYISNLLIIEGKKYSPQRDNTPFFLESKNNPDLISNSVDKLWVVDHEDLFDKGIFTVAQLRKATDEGLIIVENPTVISLVYFDYEDYIENIDLDYVIQAFQDSGLAFFTFDYISNFEEIIFRVESEESIDTVARSLLRNKVIEEIVDSDSDGVKVYFNVEGETYVRVLLI